MIDWQHTNVVVTGGAGFLGSFVVERLRARDARQVVVPRRAEYDLVRGEDVRRLLAEARPDLVIHLAARVGGIGANRMSPGHFFYENLMMGVQLMHEACRAGVKKLVATNGGVLVVGGLKANTPLATAERFDARARKWVPAGEMAAPRGLLSATRLASGSGILVAGGIHGAGAQRFSSRVDLYQHD